jgi:glycerol-3-phosphate O-acyltransferase
MAEIGKVVPVVPVSLVALALARGARTEADLVMQADGLTAELQAKGAVLRLAPQGMAETVREGLGSLRRRGLITATLQPTPGAQGVLDFYAAGVAQFLSENDPKTIGT